MTPESTASRSWDPTSALAALKITWTISCGSRCWIGEVLRAVSENWVMGTAMVMWASVTYSSDSWTLAPAGLRKATVIAPRRTRSPSRSMWVLTGLSLTNVPLTLLLSSMKYWSPCR